MRKKIIVMETFHIYEISYGCHDKNKREIMTREHEMLILI